MNIWFICDLDGIMDGIIADLDGIMDGIWDILYYIFDAYVCII